MRSHEPATEHRTAWPQAVVTRDDFQPDPTTQEKVTWLRHHLESAFPSARVDVRETHMSWIFLVGNRAYKLKKPVRFPYLNFSTLQRREQFCHVELELNRRLASDVYLDVVPMRLGRQGISIDGSGRIIDWLVVMRRLAEGQTLENAIAEKRVATRHIYSLADRLSNFYSRAKRPYLRDVIQFNQMRKTTIADCRILLEPGLGLPSHLVRRVATAQRHYLQTCREQIGRRVRQRRFIDAHGDLRPEHIWLDDGIRIIDCLEFDARLRCLDPVDELSFLSLECERLGSAAVGAAIYRRAMQKMHDAPPPALFHFYRCHRGLLRARLAIAHLLEPSPRTPEKWPRRAREYLAIAVKDAFRLEQLIKTQRGRRVVARHAIGGPSRPGGGQLGAPRPCRATIPRVAGRVGPSPRRSGARSPGR